jgi:hypothetical protein
VRDTNRGVGAPRKGLVKTLVSLEPKQLKALRAEAMKRMKASGAGRMDASEVLREVLDAWLSSTRR